MSEHQRYEDLLMREVDGRLDADGWAELERHLGECDDCSAELEDFRRIKQTTDAMTARILADAAIEPPRERGATRWLVRGSFVSIIAGVVLLFGYGAYDFAHATLPWSVKLGVGLIAAGVLALLGQLARVRVAAAGRDPYEEIDQ